jgi:hypothetical protein
MYQTHGRGPAILRHAPASKESTMQREEPTMNRRIAVIGTEDLGPVIAGCVGRISGSTNVTIAIVADVADIRMMPGAIRAATDADVIAIATDWPQFISFDLGALRRVMRGNLFVDGRRNFNRELIEHSGFEYSAITSGPPATVPHRMVERSVAPLARGELLAR